MNYSKLILALGLSLAAVLAGNKTPRAYSADEPADALAPADILKKAQEKYASLTSYTDEGKTITSLNGMTITTTFSIKLARPNLYRVGWTQSGEGQFNTSTNKLQAVWSAGEGDFLDMGKGAEKQKSREMALAAATGISSGAAADIPGTFFKLNWGNQLNISASIKRQPDEKVGDVDCYVVADEMKGQTRTLWIGKQDSLIHQVRNTPDAAAMKAALDEAAKGHPEIRANVLKTAMQGMTATETHTNIVLDQKLSATDFGPQK